nr:PREDICTED: uncharacterized protein LOC109033763 [Bemisia tabaci]
MYSPVARKYFHLEMSSSLDEKMKSSTPFSEAAADRRLSVDNNDSSRRRTLKRHQSLPNVTNANKAINHPSSPIDSLTRIDSDLQLMKVIQERDKMNLELIKLQKMNQNLQRTLNTERENFETCKLKLSESLHDEKVRESLKTAELKYSINKKLAKQFKNLLEEKEKQLESLKVENEITHSELKKKEEQVNTICHKCSEKGIEEEDATARVQILEAQLTRAREISISERKVSKELQTELWKKERELKDTKIDLRIAQRSLKSAEESIKKLNEEGFEYASAALKEKEAVFNEEKESLQGEVKKLRGELEKAQTELNEEKSSFAAVKNDLLIMETKLNESQHKVKRLEHKYETLESNFKTSETQIKELKAQLENKEINNAALKATCMDMDSQLDAFENLNEDLRKEKANLEERVHHLKEELDQAKADLKTTRIELNEERSLKIAAESKLSIVTKDFEEAKKEQDEWKSKTFLIENQLRSLEIELDEKKEKFFMLEEDFDKYQKHAELLANENISLKEERSNLLTQIHSGREKIFDLEEKVNSLHKKVSELQSHLTNAETEYRQKEIKYESTVQQQNKLINFLQNHIDGLKKKKRTFAEKLLRSPNKENLDHKVPSTIITSGFRQPNSMTTKTLSLGKESCYRGILPGLGESKKRMTNPLSDKNNKTTAEGKNLSATDKQKMMPKGSLSKPVVPAKTYELKQSGLPQCYKGEILRFFDKTEKLQINCIEQIKDSLYLLGCDEGLFSLRTPPTERKQIVKISGVSFVTQIALLRKLDMALLISGESSSMTICNLRQLLCNVEAAECSKPTIEVSSLYDNTVFAPDVVHPPKLEAAGLTNCYTFSVSPCNSYLCVASAGYITFLKWKTLSFQCIKQIKSEQPVSWFTIFPDLVIFSTDKLYRMELSSGLFVIEPFLDQMDVSLSYLNKRSSSGPYPMAVFEISPNEEYLVCFNICGVFVNTHGKRSRDDDIKWSHLPLAFVYSEPLLTVVHFSSVSVMKISATHSMRMSNSSSGSGSSPDIVNIGFSSLRLLGTSKRHSRIFLSNMENRGLSIIDFNPGHLFKDDCDVLSYVSSDTGSSSCPASSDLALRREIEALDLSADFSFSSSLNRSLETSSDISASFPNLDNLPPKSNRQVRFHNVSTAM